MAKASISTFTTRLERLLRLADARPEVATCHVYEGETGEQAMAIERTPDAKLTVLLTNWKPRPSDWREQQARKSGREIA